MELVDNWLKLNINAIFFSIIFAALAILFLPYNPIPILLISALMAIYFFGERLLLGLIIINFTTSLTEYVGDFRIYFNMIATISLTYLFLKKYGLDFKNYPKLPKEIIYFIIFLFISLFVSSSFSVYAMIGFISLVTMFLFFGICYIFYSLITDDKDIYVYIYSLCVAVFILAIRIFTDLIILGPEKFFMKAVLEDNSELAGSTGYTGFTIFFITIAFISVILFLGHIKKGISKTILISFLILNIVTLIFANSRAAIVSAFLSVGFLLLILKKALFLKIISFTILVFAILFFTVPEVEDTINAYIRIDSVNQRDVFWGSGVDVISDYPLLGVGPGVFYKYFYSYSPSSLSSFFDLDIWRFGKPSPHNLFLYYWAENGILGFVLSISLFVMFFYFGFKTISLAKHSSREYYILSVAITGLGIGLLFRAFFEVTGLLYYGYITTDLPFWIIFGVLMYIYQSLNRKNELQLKNGL